MEPVRRCTGRRSGRASGRPPGSWERVSDVALAQARLQFYTVTTREIPIPNPLDASGNLQEDVLCRSGDLAVGGGHIVHPSSTTGVFVTKSYATNAAGDFAPANADRWRVKVLNPNAFEGKRLTVHVVCTRTAP